VVEKYHNSKNYKYGGVNAQLDEDSKHVWGDSGGPLFTEDGELYGILSGGSLKQEDLDKGTTAVYTSITDIHDWIENTTGKKFFDGTHNKDIDKQLEGISYKFKTVDSFKDHREQEYEALQKFLNEEIDLQSIGKSIGDNLYPKLANNRYVDPTIKDKEDNVEENEVPTEDDHGLTDEEKQDLKNNIDNSLVEYEDVVENTSHNNSNSNSNRNGKNVESNGTSSTNLTPANNKITGDFSGGTSSSVDGELEVTDGVKADTGGRTLPSIISKIRSIF